MSRVARRGSASARSRRATKGSATRTSLPLVPIGVALVGVIAVVGLIAYLVMQSDESSSTEPGAAQELELDPAPELPGEYVNLPEAFAEGGVLAGYHLEGAPDTATHVQTNVDYSGEATANSTTGLPPAGGPHWGSAACGSDPASAPPYCGPAPWGIFREEWPEETIVHNMEHGGVVVWYNTSDSDIQQQIEALARDYIEDGKYLIVMPYSNIPADTVALTAWARRDVVSTSDFTTDRMSTFIDTFMCRFNPEDFPACGSM